MKTFRLLATTAAIFFTAQAFAGQCEDMCVIKLQKCLSNKEKTPDQCQADHVICRNGCAVR